MGWLWHNVKKSEIVAGDHIYTWRSYYTYSHHGIYVGENKVVHFTSDLNFGSSSSSSSSSSSFITVSSSVSLIPHDICLNLPDCGFRKSKSGVILSCVDCFLSGGSLCRYQYSVSKYSCIAKRVGTCTTAKPDPPEKVIHRAMYLLQHGFGNYSMLRNNCEDFALYCKTGLLLHDGKQRGISSQAGSVALASKAAIKSSPVMYFSGPIGLPIATGILYYMYRSDKDIGVRTDVANVKLEHINDFLRS